jgi:hypothetical protein
MQWKFLIILTLIITTGLSINYTTSYACYNNYTQYINTTYTGDNEDWQIDYIPCYFGCDNSTGACIEGIAVANLQQNQLLSFALLIIVFMTAYALINPQHEFIRFLLLMASFFTLFAVVGTQLIITETIQPLQELGTLMTTFMYVTGIIVIVILAYFFIQVIKNSLTQAGQRTDRNGESLE